MKQRIALYSLILIIIGLGLYFLNPIDYKLYPKCPVKLLTGLSCPGCGIQRFFHALMHGHFAEAIHYNYFLIYSLPYTLVLIIGALLPKGDFRKKYVRYAEHRYLVYFYLVSYFIWFAVRNIFSL